jgi:hypothetical protein
MSTITKLWAAGNLPIRDGLYTAAGESYAVRLDAAAPGGLEILAPFDLDAVLAPDPDYVTSIDITGWTELPGGAGWLCRGEGSYGSEGFFARTDAARNLTWVIYLEESNPVIDISVSGGVATFTSSSEIVIRVEIDRPWSTVVP